MADKASLLALYEISMSIGNSLELSQMLNETVSTILSRLGCTSLTIHQNEEEHLALLYAKPKFIMKNEAYQNLVALLHKDLKEQGLQSLLVEQDGKVYYGFELKNFGTLVLSKSDGVLSEEVVHSLPKLLSKLLTAIKACQNHAKLGDAMKAAEAANQAKSLFLANMSHEIRTPMNAILGFVSILMRSEEDPKRKHFFEIINSSGQTLLSIINDILDFSKIESGKMSFEMLPYETSSLFMETALLFDAQASQKKILFEKFISKELPKKAITDKARLKQVLHNLLSNAMKFTPEEGRVLFEVHYDASRELLLCSVSDSGIGIAPEHQASIFNAFEQADNSITRKFGGTGLGLAICSSIIKQMHGELSLESEAGKGSRFYFEIPFVAYEKSAESFSAQAQEKKTALSAHVLIVEDNVSNQTLLGTILQEAGVTYDVANDGEEGVLRFMQQKYDLVFMDENMPRKNGLLATAEIRAFEQKQQQAKTPIVAVTANALQGDRERFLNAGLDAFIAKPYRDEEILEVLQRYLGEKKKTL